MYRYMYIILRTPGFAMILKVLLTKLFQNDWTTVKISWRKVCFYKKCQILCNSYFRHIFHNKKSLQFSSIVSQNFIHKIVWKCNHNTLNHFLTFSFYLVDLICRESSLSDISWLSVLMLFLLFMLRSSHDIMFFPLSFQSFIFGYFFWINLFLIYKQLYDIK